ncbi:MAG TPA: ABC transporter permease [Gemmatimonadaceae bacterium]|nr:ABC transporter permease [Gemmatimonadaceae bacterium]
MPRPPDEKREFRFAWRSARQVASEVDAELAFHLARKTEELMAAGLSAAAAREEAEQRFGDLERTRRYCRDEDVRREREARHSTMLDELRQDLGYAVRALRSAPGFTLVALVTLALGIGANTAIFSVVRGVLLRPLPFPQAEQVMRIWHVNREANVDRSAVSEPDFNDWRAATTRFATLGAYWYQPGNSGANLTAAGRPERLEGTYITPGFFETLRASAALGRTIRSEEAVVGNDRYVMLGHDVWQRRFGGDSSIVGRAITIDRGPFTVLGVMPREFTFPADGVDFWIPLSTIPEDGIGRQRSSRFLAVIGRLAPGVTQTQGNEELTAIARRVAEGLPNATGFTEVTMSPIEESILGEVRRPLFVLLGAVGFVLLITCVNIAGLLLARATARQSELAVRAALGAGRGRIVRQLLTESLVLALAGGALGVGLAYAGVRALSALGASELPRAALIGMDPTVVAYAFGVATLSGMLFGLVPAMRATAPGLQMILRGTRGIAGTGGQRLRSALVAAEVALAVVLVAGAGLAARSFVRLLDVDPGFEPGNVLAVSLSIDSDRYPDERFLQYHQALLDRIAQVPGVQVVGAAKNFPLRGTGEVIAPVVAPGGGGRPDSPAMRLPILHVSPDYFRAMGIPLRAGRTFTPADRAGAPLVLLVNEALARRAWPDESAVGKTLRVGEQAVEIVGVVGDVRQRSLTEPAEPTVYIHYLQNRRSGMNIAIRTAGPPLRYANAVREAIWELERDQTITSLETMSSIVGRTLARPRLLTSLLLLFGLMGLSLGALGIYGVLAYAVSQRRQEIGVRVALGASPRSVLGLVVGQGMRLALVGVVAGIAGAALLTRLMAAVLFEVRPGDPATFAMVVVVLLGTAFVASWLPARRALRVDPVQALRYE